MQKKEQRTVPLVTDTMKADLRKKFSHILQEVHTESAQSMLPVVRAIHRKRDRFLTIAHEHDTPCFVLDDEALEHALTSFTKEFSRAIPDISAYFAVKVNDHPHVLRTIVKHGYGLDVSSERELRLALNAKAKRIIYTGPAKTHQGLTLACKHASRVIIHMDSFRELELLAEVAATHHRTINTGIRITSAKKWNKFGIPLNELRRFYDIARAHKHINLCGIQVHQSWNTDAQPYVETMHSVAEYLQANFSQEELAGILFYDFGGGFVPDATEGEYPWYPPQGKVVQAIYEYFDTPAPFPYKHHTFRSTSLHDYAQGIALGIDTHLRPLLPNATYLTEPGRIIADSAMHVLLRIADRKDGLVIVDGGMNMIGYERFEDEYFPIINITHPSTKEIDTMIYGSLCMMQDRWGYSCFASRLEIGDLIVVPNQGALTYSLAQDFIHGKPPVYTLPRTQARKEI